ncbi:MAG: AarF/ABC1/UbiB kinase family protein [Candidatus Electrothrix sp. AR3]|nr:AarF/ABC1/UbiB kinase family protein [Candidatus Electrothrix sp. AR3]
MEQIFLHGFFHADPHPGNIFILPDNIICFIDFGQVGRLLLKDREDFTDFIISIATGDENKIVAGILKMTIQHGELDRDILTLDISDFINRYLYLTLGELKVGKIHQELLRLLSRHRLFLKPNLYLMLKALGTVEGVGLMLDPHIELLSLAKPFMKKIRFNRICPGRLAEEFSQAGSQYLNLIRDLPSETRSILSQLQKGEMKMEFEHRGLRPLEQSLYRASNRIAFAIVLAALIIGSSLVVNSANHQGSPIPMIGVIGFIIAGIMGFWLLISIIRRGRL